MAKKSKATAKELISQVFSAKAARNGGIVRRKISSVALYASEKALQAEVKRRKFHMVITGDQYVIMCNKGDWQVIC